MACTVQEKDSEFEDSAEEDLGISKMRFNLFNDLGFTFCSHP